MARKVATKVRRLLKDPWAFECWLMEAGPGAIVGYPRSARACPVARWLSEVTGRAILVTRGAVAIPGEADVDPPQWLIDLVSLVDEVSGETVTAAQCLDILEVVRKVPGRMLHLF